MTGTDVIIIGAGASGLMAARELVKRGKKVQILEARGRIGGRIHTIHEEPGTELIELGAEFVHGPLETTLALLKEAGIAYHPTGGKMWRHKDGVLKQEDHNIEHWETLAKKLKALDEDMTIDDFLEQHFASDGYSDMRTAIRNYASGYDTADTSRASSLALRDEWLSEDEGGQYRLDKGYREMIDYLAKECKAGGAEIVLNAVVKKIHWSDGNVHIFTTDERSYASKQVIVTVPLGVLQANDIHFSPAIPEILLATQQMGFGSIIKLLFLFKDSFWKLLPGMVDALEDMAFIISGEMIPTWWTQYPNDSPLLTGWLGGPRAAALKDADDTTLRKAGLASLAAIFNMEMTALESQLVSSHIANWTAARFTKGSYEYATTETEKARALISKGVHNTIFFGGEGMYGGKEMGTVEAALKSGIDVARKI